MSTAKAAIVESISKRRLLALPSRKASPAARLEKIKELAGNLLDEAESLDPKMRWPKLGLRLRALRWNRELISLKR